MQRRVGDNGLAHLFSASTEVLIPQRVDAENPVQRIVIFCNFHHFRCNDPGHYPISKWRLGGLILNTDSHRVSQSLEKNQISGVAIQAACKVHTALGPGLLETVYQACLKHELLRSGLKVLSEVGIPIVYDGVNIDGGYRIDILVEEIVVVELKAVERVAPIHRVQLLTYLKLSKLPLGLLLNFNVKSLKDGIVRVIN